MNNKYDIIDEIEELETLIKFKNLNPYKKMMYQQRLDILRGQLEADHIAESYLSKEDLNFYE